jgi:hypothetical protein
MKLGPMTYVAHYIYAEEKYHLTSHGGDMYGRIEGDPAAEIRGELLKSIAMMPSFGPSHELLGFFEMVQGDNLATAEQQLHWSRKTNRISSRWRRCSSPSTNSTPPAARCSRCCCCRMWTRN